MSESITIISTTNAAVSPSFNFDIMNIPNGVPIHLTADVEALRTKGVDGTVYRELGKQNKPFSIRAIAYHLDFAAALAFARDLELCRNSFVTINHTIHGIHTNIFCSGVNVTPLAGEPAGPNIVPGLKAYTVSSFSMVRG